jgi:hypothetical protein
MSVRSVRSECIDPRFLQLGTGLRRVVTLVEIPQYELDRSLDGPQEPV